MPASPKRHQIGDRLSGKNVSWKWYSGGWANALASTASNPVNNGIWGDGSRVPAIFIGPHVKRGYVDHTQYDTLSILKTIEERFGLAPLNTLDAKAASLAGSLRSD